MENINLLPESEYTEMDGRLYLQPNLPVTQTNEFIDKYRASQIANNNQIAQQTRNLGTSVPSNLGGLTGAGSYFTSRYQTPQTNAVAQNLRTAAQAQALNTALANEQAYWQKKYQDAYKKYQKSAYDKANTPSGNPGTTNLMDILKKLGVVTNPDDNEKTDVNPNPNADKTETMTGTLGGLNQYTDAGGNRWTLRNLQSGDDTLLGGLTGPGGHLLRTFPDGTPLENGAVYDAGGGRVFMYIRDGKYPNGNIFRVGDSPLVSYK